MPHKFLAPVICYIFLLPILGSNEQVYVMAEFVEHRASKGNISRERYP
jgi:hypothetical protein